MYFRLTDHYALRSWSGVICAYYEKNVSHAKPLTRRQADILIQCDGEHDIEINDTVDNAPLMTEWSYEELCDLLDQARDCGIQAFTVTGGEPMVHPHFMDILRGIHERGMFVENLITNGSCSTGNMRNMI